MAIKSFKRYEKKYLLTGEQYEKLIPRLLEYKIGRASCRERV